MNVESIKNYGKGLLQYMSLLYTQQNIAFLIGQ